VESYPILGFPGYDDFFGFGLKLGIPERRVIRLLEEFRAPKPLFETMVQRSYLSDKGKELYMAAFRDRIRAFSYSLAKRV
jgi:serine/threonine-protein kinase HipA